MNVDPYVGQKKIFSDQTVLSKAKNEYLYHKNESRSTRKTWDIDLL